MSTTPNDDGVSDKRRILWTIAAAVAFPALLLLVGETDRPELAFALIPLTFGGLAVYQIRRNRRTREGTDERARDMHRRASGFAFQVSLAALATAAIWLQFTDGSDAAAPHIAAGTVLIGSYAVAILWLRWRG